MTTIHSICTRCGKTRIVQKSWVETRDTMIGVASINYTKLVCPDVNCQKAVEEILVAEETRRVEAIQLRGQYSPSYRAHRASVASRAQSAKKAAAK